MLGNAITADDFDRDFDFDFDFDFALTSITSW